MRVMVRVRVCREQRMEERWKNKDRNIEATSQWYCSTKKQQKTQKKDAGDVYEFAAQFFLLLLMAQPSPF